MTEDAELKRIRWHCRRGMLELDQLFERYLQKGYPHSDANERQVFLRLLEIEDDQLWRWCMGYEECEDAQIAALIQHITTLPH